MWLSSTTVFTRSPVLITTPLGQNWPYQKTPNSRGLQERWNGNPLSTRRGERVVAPDFNARRGLKWGRAGTGVASPAHGPRRAKGVNQWPSLWQICQIGPEIQFLHPLLG